MRSKEPVRLSPDEVTLILEELDIYQSLDLGATLIHTGRHSTIGLMIFVSDVNGMGAYLSL